MPEESAWRAGTRTIHWPPRADVEKWLFTNDGRDRDLGVWRRRPLALRLAFYADEDHVPVGAGPTFPLSIAREPLLLRAGVDVAVDEGVGDPAAGGPAAVLMENEIARDMHAAEKDGLRNSPLHFTAGGRDGEALHAAPEGAGGVVAREAGVGVDVAGDVDRVRRCAKADDLRVKADGDVEFVFAGQEEDGVALGAEFAVLLDGVDGVNLALHVGGGHGGREDEDVGTEIGSGLGCGLGAGGMTHQKSSEKRQ